MQQKKWICRQIARKKSKTFFGNMPADRVDLPADHKKKFIFMPELSGSRARNGCLLRYLVLRKKIL